MALGPLVQSMMGPAGGGCALPAHPPPPSPPWLMQVGRCPGPLLVMCAAAVHTALCVGKRVAALGQRMCAGASWNWRACGPVPLGAWVVPTARENPGHMCLGPLPAHLPHSSFLLLAPLSLPLQHPLYI